MPTPQERLREAARQWRDRADAFGRMAGALFRIAQGVEDPRKAAAQALLDCGAADLASLADTEEVESDG